MYYVYMMRCSDNSLYTGITTDLERRFKEHTGKDGKGAKYTRSRSVTQIAAAWETGAGRAEASRLENRLKKLKKDKKEMLCRNPEKVNAILDGEADFKPVDIQIHPR